MGCEDKPVYSEPSAELDILAENVVRAAFKVHTKLGPGLLERIYRDALIIELVKSGLNVKKEVIVQVYYDGIRLEGYYIIDILVEDKLIIELKTVEELSKLHKSQLRTYLKISKLKLGLLINFNTSLIKDGIKRVISDTSKMES